MAYIYNPPNVQIQQQFTQTPVNTVPVLPALIIGKAVPLATDIDYSGNPLQVVTNQGGVCNSAQDVLNQLGTQSPSNPCAQGVYNALLNSNGAPVYFIAISAEGGEAYATGTITSSGTQVTANDTVTINSVVYTFVSTSAACTAAGDVYMGSSATAAMQNLAYAINGTVSQVYNSVTNPNGVYYPTASVGTNANNTANCQNGSVWASVNGLVLTLTAVTAGTAGNSITLAKSATTLTVSAADLAGGVAIGSSAITQWTYALGNIADKSSNYYGLVPVYSSAVSVALRSLITAAIIADVEAQSAPLIGHWRVAWFSTPVAGGAISGTNISTYIGDLPIASDATTSSDNYRRFHNIFPGTYTIGNVSYDSCFICAALAGLRSGNVPHQPLTNMPVNLGGNAYLTDVVITYSVTVLNELAEAGCWILTQDVLGGTCYTRHQLTAEGANSSANLNYSEDSLTSNIDSISYGLSAVLKPFKGSYNITPANTLKIRSAVNNQLNYYATGTYTESAGQQVISYSNLVVAQDATFLDQTDASVTLSLPYPNNFVVLQLSA